MRSLILSLALASGLLFAQHEAAPKAEEHKSEAATHEKHEGAGEKHEEEPSIIWKWVNFAILAGGLGYLIGKNAPAFFQTRTSEIQSGISEATRLKQEADQRAAAMEKRMANLEAEIASLRAVAKSEIEVEANRVGAETAQLLAKIQAHTEAEITSAAKHASLELKAFTAKLALELAETKLRGQMNVNTDRELIGEFLKGLNN